MLVGMKKCSNKFALKIAEIIIAKKALNLDVKNKHNETALYKASDKGDRKLVKKITRAGGDPNIANNKGNTPLHKAVKRGDETIARYLLECGADYNHANKKGDTPQKIAKNKKRAAILTLIAQREKLEKKEQGDKKDLGSESGKLNSDVDENACSVCFESLKKDAVITLQCGHTFHEECLKSLATCPLCRNPI
jgi:ankyrin repeat protein